MAVTNKSSVIYSIQRTYILKPVFKREKVIVTCNQRIDIPTIEPLTKMRTFVYPDRPLEIIPVIELAGDFLDLFNFTFETNEGVTVLPLKIGEGSHNPLENPYLHDRYVLVLPRGTTGVKSCKIIDKATGFEAQHNFTFGVMPPPYNYDNALFGVISARVKNNTEYINILDKNVTNLEARVIALENKAGG